MARRIARSGEDPIAKSTETFIGILVAAPLSASPAQEQVTPAAYPFRQYSAPEP
jgi:hypothetical protein